MPTRYLNLGMEIIKSNITRLSHPYKVTHAVTYRCNSRCLNCGIWEKEPRKELSLDEIKKFYKTNSYLKWVDVTGGEIFLRDDIQEILKAIIDSCPDLVNLHYPTNGLLTDRILDVTGEIAPEVDGKLIVTVSMDGPPMIHDKIRGVDGNWGKAVETYRGLNQIPGVEAYLGMTLSRENTGLVGETIKSVKQEIPSVSARNFHLNIAHASTHYYNNPESETPKKAAEDVKRFLKERGIPLNPVSYLEKKYLSKIESYLDSGQTPIPCMAANTSCFIDPQGGIYPCSIWDNKIGSLTEIEYDLKNLWNKKQAVEAAEKAYHKKCPNCWTPCEAYQSILGNLP